MIRDIASETITIYFLAPSSSPSSVCKHNYVVNKNNWPMKVKSIGLLDLLDNESIVFDLLMRAWATFCKMTTIKIDCEVINL